MTPNLTEAAVREAMRAVKDPDLKKDLVTLGMVKQVRIDAGRVTIEIELTTPACPMKELMRRDAVAAVRKLEGVEAVTVDFSANTVGGRREAPPAGAASGEHGPPPKEDLAPGVRNIIGVASGKGGVGKSTVAVNLALALAGTGARVGLLDADIYGPNLPTMLGLSEPPKLVSEGGRDRMLPIEKFGIKAISMGLLLPPDTPVIWRGPMLNKALRQFFADVVWGELDYMIVDLPPGTGDVQISLIQLVNVTGCIIVSTPQLVSLEDARKGLNMFRQVEVPVLGLIENMSWFTCDQCDKRHYIFDHGGAARAAGQLGVPFLGAIPIGVNVREGGDAGRPVVVADPDCEQSVQFREIAGNLAQAVSLHNLTGAPTA